MLPFCAPCPRRTRQMRTWRLYMLSFFFLRATTSSESSGRISICFGSLASSVPADELAAACCAGAAATFRKRIESSSTCGTRVRKCIRVHTGE